MIFGIAQDQIVNGVLSGLILVGLASVGRSVNHLRREIRAALDTPKKLQAHIDDVTPRLVHLEKQGEESKQSKEAIQATLHTVQRDIGGIKHYILNNDKSLLNLDDAVPHSGKAT